jgi:integrase
MRALGSPFAQMFYLGNRSGLRLGEILGLRLGDLDEIGAGAIRVAHSYDGPLKEDRHASGKTKWVPSPSDAVAVLGPYLERRRAAGADAAALVFVDHDGDPFDRHQVAYRWRGVRSALGLPGGMTWYQGTRHSCASRALASGAGVDEIAAALGHSSPAITARHYLHYVRKHFSPILCAGLGLDADGAPVAKVIAMSAPAAPAESTDESSGPAKPAQRGTGHAA